MNKLSFLFHTTTLPIEKFQRLMGYRQKLNGETTMHFGPATVLISAHEEGEPPHPARPQLNLVHPDPLIFAYSHSLAADPHSTPQLSSAIRHVLSHPGSFHRARLSSRIATDYGAESAQSVSLATALEYYHTASLIFDDLPCMDDARIRRGAECVHLEFGEHEAILTALALINRAYALVWQVLADLPRPLRMQGMVYLEECLGVAGILAGQSSDLNYAALPHTAQVAGRIAWGKTVSLIRLSLVWPALLFGASAREVTLLERLAFCWGLAYQAADDLKDVLQNDSTTGKTAGRDLLLGRPNLAISIGIPATAARLERLVRLGDANLRLLLLRRPSLHFMEEFRDSLNEEVASLTGPHLQATLKGCA